MRILLAEDDDSMRMFLRRALERAGHDVIAVAWDMPFVTPRLLKLIAERLSQRCEPGLGAGRERIEQDE